MNHKIHLPERPFRAILKGTKKVEGRAGSLDKKYENMRPNDILTFINEQTYEKLITTIVFIHHYKNVKSMLETEGVENMLSSFPKTVEHGIESYHSFSGYKERIAKYGIYAIGIKIN